MNTLPVDSIPEPVLFLLKKLERAHHRAFVVGGAGREHISVYLAACHGGCNG